MTSLYLRVLALVALVSLFGPADAAVAPADPCAFPHLSEIAVRDAAGLTSALAAAEPGTMIRLAPGTYRGRFISGRSGTAQNKVVVCGPRTAVLDSGTVSEGYTMHVKNSNYWILSGFTVTRGKDGVMLDRSNFNLVTDLLIHNVGHSGIHVRTFSSDNTLTYNQIRDTGKYYAGYGEGIYIGTAVSNWQTITGSSTTPDRCNRTRVRYNTLGPNITAEAIDIKEGTSGGRIRGNVFDGTGMTGANYGDSWMDVKGNGYLITGNTGVNTLKDAFQVHQAVVGWGKNNVFENNFANVKASGYGFMLDGKSTGNVVRCNNVVQSAGAGFANVSCSS